MISDKTADKVRFVYFNSGCSLAATARHFAISEVSASNIVSNKGRWSKEKTAKRKDKLVILIASE
jgi:hypothetical protein